MGVETKIQWTHHTFNPWWGCQRVSPGCQHCYAETFDKRVGGKHWGPTAPRRFFGAKHWNEPLKWARAALKAGERHRVFCASMADVFEDHPALEPERQKLWALIRATVNVEWIPDITEDFRIGRGGLDWLLLTKRPENVLRMAPLDILPLVWVGTTVEDPERARARLLHLVWIPARVRFVSAEPLLAQVDFTRVPVVDPDPQNGPGAWLNALTGHVIGPDDVLPHHVDWVIVGGESGPGARPFDLAWARSIRDQCAAAAVPCFVKQLGAVPATEIDVTGQFRTHPTTGKRQIEMKVSTLGLKDRKGGDPSEWPEDLRVRQFPEVRRG